MNRFSCALCFLLLVIGSVFSEDFVTVDGEHYTGATLKRVEPDGLVISYRDGVAKLKFKNLSSDIQEKYKYNPEAEKDFLEKSQTEEVKRFQENQPTLYTQTTTSPVPINSNQLLDKKIEAARYNCDVVKNRIASLEQELLQQSSQQGRVYLQEDLAKKKLELPIKEAILAKLLAQKYPPPPPPPAPPASFLQKYGTYLMWSLIGFFGVILFLWKTK